MNPLRLALLAFCAAAPVPALSEATPPPEAAAVPTRPDDAAGTKPPSDGLAECAAILAIASTHHDSLIDRNAVKGAAAAWFAASGDLAITEGAPPAAGAWEEKVVAWAGQLGSLDALGRNGDWMAYCAHVGAARGLDTRSFPVSPAS